MNDKPKGVGWWRKRSGPDAAHTPRWVHSKRRLNVDIEEWCPLSEWHVRPVVYGHRVTVWSWGNLLSTEDAAFVREAFALPAPFEVWKSPDCAVLTFPQQVTQ